MRELGGPLGATGNELAGTGGKFRGTGKHWVLLGVISKARGITGKALNEHWALLGGTGMRSKELETTREELGERYGTQKRTRTALGEHWELLGDTGILSLDT